MYSDKVHDSVVRTRVHHEPSVVSDPQRHVAIPFRQVMRGGVLQNFLTRNEEAKSRLARVEGLEAVVHDFSTGNRLQDVLNDQRGTSRATTLAWGTIVSMTYTRSIRANDQIAFDRRSVCKGNC